MFADTELETSLIRALTNAINFKLFPSRTLRLGRYEKWHFEKTYIVWRRTGNLSFSGSHALTYDYEITGEDFKLSLVVIYGDEDQSTAKIMIREAEGNQDTIFDWVVSVLNTSRSPRDWSTSFGPF